MEGVMISSKPYEHIGHQYAGIFNSFVQESQKHENKINELIEQETNFSLRKESYYITMESMRVDTETLAKNVAVKMIERMVGLAEDMFAPNGSRLKIDKGIAYQALGFRDGYCDDRKYKWSEKFNPNAIWSALVENYAGEKGEEEGYRQTAAAILSSFYCLRDGKQVRMVAGRVVLEKSIFIDSIDKKWSKKNKLSYSCCEDLSKALTSLKGFASWMGSPQLLNSLNSAQYQICDHRGEIISRATYGGNGIKIVTYITNVEFHLDPNIAEQFQIFLGLYAYNDEMKEAA